jgi:hypothetical protein
MRREVLTVILLLGAAPASATRLARPEEPIVISGADVSLLLYEENTSIAAFAWLDGAFQPLPLQIDERGPDGGYFGDDEYPGVLDANDELVFMAEDAGEQVAPCCWLEGADAVRTEVAVLDPLDGARGWVYLFTGHDLPRSPADYVQITGWEPFAVHTDRYEHRYEKGNADILTELRILPPAGNGTDMLDRFKIRMKLGPLTPWLTEADATHSVTKRHSLDGPVRAIHGYWVSLGKLLDITHVYYTYYRRMTVIHNQVNQFWPTGLRHMAILYDLDPTVSGLVTHYDNRGANPAADATYADTIDGLGPWGVGELGLFVEWASPTLGSSVIVQDNRDVSGTARTYYADEAAVNNDAWPDTGDGETWGQQGVWLENIPPSQFSLDAWTFYLPGRSTSSGGALGRRYLYRMEATPLGQAREECDCTVGLKDQAPVPSSGETALEVAFSPNPFNPSTSILVTIPAGDELRDIQIFDIRGQLVRRFNAGATGTRAPQAQVFRLRWTGDDQRGQQLPSALYTCQVRSRAHSVTAHILLLK